MNSSLAQFDRDIPLPELVRAVPRTRLEAALKRTIGDAWRIVDDDGSLVLESGPNASLATVAVPLRLDIEVIGSLLAPEARKAHAQIAAGWLEMVLVSAHRYRMAADLHLEAVHADYEALQQKHAALQESEARYRELAGELEQRVQAQVATIEQTQRQLYQAEKMASIGSLAAGMAHEINNPIGFIRSNLGSANSYFDTMGKALTALRQANPVAAEAIWRDFDIDFILEDMPGLLAESVSGADRITRIVANLKAYSSIDCVSDSAVDLNEAVRAAAGVIADQLPDNIRLEADLQPLRRVICDIGRMNQVLFSLLQNARQAIGPEGGVIRVASSMSGNEARIAVSDNGCGIGSDVLSRIFDPFFTTRDVGKGMGLGLTVSRDIVAAHNGRIEVETSAGAGSTFTVCIPAGDAAGTANQISSMQ